MLLYLDVYYVFYSDGVGIIFFKLYWLAGIPHL